MKDIIQYSDFDKLDLRAGKVISATEPEWSRKLFELKVDFGPELGERTIMAGGRGVLAPDDFVDKKFVFVVNLAEKKMGESISQGMMLMADGEEGPIPFALPDSIELGSVIR